MLVCLLVCLFLFVGLGSKELVFVGLQLFLFVVCLFVCLFEGIRNSSLSIEISWLLVLVPPEVANFSLKK